MPLNPPQDYRKTEFTHRQGLAANRPAASDVLVGTLYFSTDTLTLERSNGLIWTSYAPAGGGPPALHAPTHSSGGTDPVTVTNLAGYPGGTANFLRADGTFATPPINGGIPALHAPTHSQGGTDPVDVKNLTGYPGGTTTFLRADKTFAAPAAAAGLGGCAVFRTTDMLIPDAAFTSVPFDAEDFDTDNYHDNAVNPSRFTIPVTGKYQLVTSGFFAANATGQRVVAGLLNGTTLLSGGGFFAGNPSGIWGTSVVFNYIGSFNAGDFIEFQYYQNSGGNLTFYGTAYYRVRAGIIRIG